MFSKFSSLFRNRFTRNAFLFYFGSQILVIGLLLVLIIFSLSHSLRNNLKQVILAKEDQLATIYMASGLAETEKQIGRDLYVRILDSRKLGIFESKLKDEEGYDQLGVLDTAHAGLNQVEWILAEKTDDEDHLWVSSKLISPEVRLQVGKSDQVVDDQIQSLLETYLEITLPLLLISFFVALFLANQIYAQINEVVETSKKIKSGELKERVLLKANPLKDMVFLFNEMLDQIEILVSKNRDELDHFAHDVKTPITRFKLMAENALIKADQPELTLEALDSANVAADEIIQMIGSLFDISLSESGAKILKASDFDLSKLIEEVLSLYELVASEKNILFEVKSETIFVHADRIQMKRVFSNVIDNAVKFSPRTSVIHVNLNRENGNAVVKVRDHGVGVLPEELNDVWKRFYRGKIAIQTTQGSGLGLAFVKAMTEANGGAVRLDSVHGEGTEFTIALKSVIAE